MPITAQRLLALVLGTIQYFLSTQLMSYRGHVSTAEKLFALIIAVIPVLLICVPPFRNMPCVLLDGALNP